MKEQKSFAAASIPVEKINCPILLISVGDDHLWHSEVFSKQIQDRPAKTNSPILCTHLNYPNAGHSISIPNLQVIRSTYYNPIEKAWFNMGGTQAANAQASYDSRNKLLVFFHENLAE